MLQAFWWKVSEPVVLLSKEEVLGGEVLVKLKGLRLIDIDGILIAFVVSFLSVLFRISSHCWLSS